MRPSLSPRPDLEQLKRQARELLRAYHAGDSTAQQRFARYLPPQLVQAPPAAGPRRVRLAHALLIVAREHGYASWPQLRQAITAVLAMPQTPARRGEPTDERRARRLARQQRIAELATPLVEAARQPDLRRLFDALRVRARDLEAVRALLVAQGTYSLVIDGLLAAVVSPHARVRFLAAQAMDHFADQRCAEPLHRLLHDPVPRVRWAALHTLQCQACKLTPLFTEHDITATLVELALHDPSIKVRRLATYELGQLCPDQRATATLELIRDQATDRTLARHARQALKHRARS